MHTQSIAISDSLHLATVSIDALAAPAALPPTVHHIGIFDISGSMWGQTELLKKHFKNKLATTVLPGHTVSLGWFYGRGQFGMIVEGVRIRDVTDLSSVHAAIDRYLNPLGLTGFKEPLQEAARVVARLRAQDPNSAVNLVFMSDGHDNQWSQKEVLDAAAALGDLVSGGAVVEYGWYANRPLLTKMAEAIGVPYVFSEDFERFAPLLDAEFGRQLDGVRKREIVLPAKPLHGVCFAVRQGAVATYGVDDGNRARIPEDVSELHFLSAAQVGDDAGLAGDFDDLLEGQLDGLYAALAVLAQRVQGDHVLAILRALGDVRLIRQFANCFGKQSYAAFTDAASEAAVDAGTRWTEGRDQDLVPAEDAYTVLDALADLMGEDGNLLHLSHPAFEYNRIGRKTSVAASQLSAEEQAEIAALAGSARSADDLARVQARIAEIAAAKPKPATFRADDRDAGVPLANLTLNETRPNVSVLVTQKGTVDVSGNPVGLPDSVPSHIFRNYAVIRDGILNVKRLPVSLGRETFGKLAAQGLVEGPWVDGSVYVVELEGLPIVNRRMVRSVSAKDVFALEYEMTRARAAQKVFKHFLEAHFPKDRAAGLATVYGPEAAEWLKSVGVTDGGFSPKVVKAEATDVYVGRELKLSLKGLSSLPKVEDVSKKLADGKKLSVSEALMAPFVLECQEFVDSKAYSGAADPRALLKTWVEGKAKAWIAKARQINRQLSEIKFSVVVGQVWFPEFDSLDDCTLVVTMADGAQVQGTAKLEEKEFEV